MGGAWTQRLITRTSGSINACGCAFAFIASVVTCICIQEMVRQWCRIFRTPKLYFERARGPDKLLLDFFVVHPVGVVHTMGWKRVCVWVRICARCFECIHHGAGCARVREGLESQRD